MQLVRQLQGQEENPFGDEAATTPKKIFQLLNQVNSYWIGCYFSACRLGTQLICCSWVIRYHIKTFVSTKKMPIGLSIWQILLILFSWLHFLKIHMKNGALILSTDHWGTILYPSTWSGFKTVLAMCWGTLIHINFYMSCMRKKCYFSIFSHLTWVCFQAANDCDLEPVAYEFFTQAYILYEEEISVSWSPFYE